MEKAEASASNVLLFYSIESPFSQHYLCNFTVDGVKYNCAEQYMMAQKALLFKDFVTANEIMATVCPMTQNRLGRGVKQFDSKLWDSQCEDIVKKGNLCKFSQNPELKRKLLSTGSSLLAEASPCDLKWGMGLDASNPASRDPTKWRGANLLGKILITIRDELRASNAMFYRFDYSSPGNVSNSSSKLTLFYGKESPFSQHYPCIFTVDGVKYNCAEQYMMASKAMLFNDVQTANQIMLTGNPMMQKQLGRKVKQFDSQIWDSVCEAIVKKGNLCKFSQNPDLKRKLLSTGSSLLVEASPWDLKWGIGLDASNPASRDPTKWRGANLLGKILTNVRDELRASNAMY